MNCNYIHSVLHYDRQLPVQAKIYGQRLLIMKQQKHKLKMLPVE